MRFLVDAQLPPALARWIASNGHQAEHVADLDMANASDRNIWQQALDTNAVIVSKDADFAELTVLRSEAPQVVWIRLRNTRRQALLNWFEALFPRIIDALERGEKLIEIE